MSHLGQSRRRRGAVSCAEDGGRGGFKSRWHRYPQAVGPALGPVFPEASWLDEEGAERTVAALGPESQASNSQPPGPRWRCPVVSEPPLAPPHMWLTSLIVIELKFNLIRK